MVAVDGSDHKPAHYGPGETSVLDDNNDIVTVPIQKVLHYPSSHANALSIRCMRLHYENWTNYEATYAMSTFDKYCFLWGRRKQNKTILDLQVASRRLLPTRNSLSII